MNTVLLILIIILVIPSTIGLLYRMHLDEVQIRARLASEARHRKQKKAPTDGNTIPANTTITIQEIPTVYTTNEDLSKELPNLTSAVEHLAVAMEHQADALLGSQANQNKQLDIIKGLLEVPWNQDNKTVESEPVNFTPNFTPSTKAIPKRKGVKKSTKLTLTKEQILQFYTDIGKESLREAGTHFGVSQQTIKNILEQ